METTNYIWMDGEMVPWDEATVHVLTHALHYGSGAFEGIRAYHTKKGPGIFRLPEHIQRLFYSAKVIGIDLPYSEEQVREATVNLLAKNRVEHCYIRPLAYYGYGKMGLNPAGAPSKLSISCWPWGAYLPHEAVDIKVSRYIRIHPRSTVPDAKICGHYVNSILAVRELAGTPYHEALFLDLDDNIAEGPGENFFIVKDGEVSTPPLGTILAGITRDTIMALLDSLGVPVQERVISLDEALSADEAFFTGTAAEVTPIRSINDSVIANGSPGVITSQVKNLYKRVVQGEEPSFEQFITYVNRD